MTMAFAGGKAPVGGIGRVEQRREQLMECRDNQLGFPASILNAAETSSSSSS
jgi:hypothetical protein